MPIYKDGFNDVMEGDQVARSARASNYDHRHVSYSDAPGKRRARLLPWVLALFLLFVAFNTWVYVHAPMAVTTVILVMAAACAIWGVVSYRRLG